MDGNKQTASAGRTSALRVLSAPEEQELNEQDC
jgi:hypothetical protein